MHTICGIALSSDKAGTTDLSGSRDLSGAVMLPKVTHSMSPLIKHSRNGKIKDVKQSGRVAGSVKRQPKRAKGRVWGLDCRDGYADLHMGPKTRN